MMLWTGWGTQSMGSDLLTDTKYSILVYVDNLSNCRGLQLNFGMIPKPSLVLSQEIKMDLLL
jgi:hypothetical protein